MMQIYVYRLDFFKKNKEFNRLKELFELYKGEEAEKFAFSEDIFRSVYSELLIYHVLDINYGLRIDEVRIGKNAYGKKFVAGYPFIHFNISHSGHWIVIALNNEEVGIDIQKEECICIDSINTYLGEQDHYRFVKKHKKKKMFYQNWVIRESFLKAIGKGFSIPFSLNDIFINRENRQISNIEHTYYYSIMDFQADYMLSVCQKKPVTNIEIIKVSEEKLTRLMSLHYDHLKGRN